MQESLFSLATQMGMSIFVFMGIFVWTYTWKILGLWKAARNNSLVWFVIIALPLNLMGILEILYIFVFSKIEQGKSTNNFLNKEKNSSKKKKSKK